MRKPRTTKEKIAFFWEENKKRIYATTLLFVVAFMLILVPFLVTRSKGTVSNRQDTMAKRVEELLKDVTSIEQARTLIEAKRIDLETNRDGSNYVWNPLSGEVYLKNGYYEPSEHFSSFDLLTGDATISYTVNDQPCYFLYVPSSVKEDLAKIYDTRFDPDRSISFVSTGAYLDFVRFAYEHTLMIEQIGEFGFSTYLGGKPAMVGSSSLCAIFGNMDTDALKDSYVETSLNLIKPFLTQTKTIILTEKTILLRGELFSHAHSLEKFVLDGTKTYRLDGNALVHKDTNTLVAYPSASKDREVVVSDFIQKIEYGAFRGATIEKITLPFVGLSRGSSFGQFGLFGYVFGQSEEGIAQIVGASYLTFAIPTSLKEIQITDETLLAKGAFSGMNMVESINLNEGIKEIQNYAFDHCDSLKKLWIPNSVTLFEISSDNVMNSLIELSVPLEFDLDAFHDFSQKNIIENRIIYTK